MRTEIDKKLGRQKQEVNNRSPLVCFHGLRRCDEVVRDNVNDASTRAVNIGYKEESDRRNDRQDQKRECASTAFAVAE